MWSDKKRKCEIRRRALLEAIRFCGGVVNYSSRLNVNRSRASNWCNQPDLNIPYEYVVLTEKTTQVSIERLSPFTEEANRMIRRLRILDISSTMLSLSLNEILIGNCFYYRSLDLDRPMIIGTDRVLISGLAQLEASKQKGLRQIEVRVLDLEALILEMRSIQNVPGDFLISERVAIGIRLESYHKNNIKIPSLLGFLNTEAYHFAKQIYLNGTEKLMAVVDQNEMALGEAAAISKLTIFEQRDCLKKNENFSTKAVYS